MEHIHTFTVEGKDLDLLYKNGSLAYSFEHEGKPYGNKVVLTSRKVIDVASATLLLLINALETRKALENDVPRNGEGA
jgi:hypothetical protein